MHSRQRKTVNFLSSILLLLIGAVFFGCAYFLITGQINANQALIEAGKAIVSSVSQSPEQEKVDYTAAITFLEAAQQAYSDNNAIKITSLLYTLATTVILGYGTKILRLGASEKENLCEEILAMTKQQLLETTTQTLRQQTEIQKALATCENITYLCFLLRSHIGLAQRLCASSGNEIDELRPTMERLQIDLTQSLQQYRDFLAVYHREKGSGSLGQEQWKMIIQSWMQANKSVQGYVNSYLRETFGEFDQAAINRLVKEFQSYISIVELLNK